MLINLQFNYNDLKLIKILFAPKNSSTKVMVHNQKVTITTFEHILHCTQLLMELQVNKIL